VEIHSISCHDPLLLVLSIRVQKFRSEKKNLKCKLALRSNFRDLLNDRFRLTGTQTNNFANIAKEIFRFELKQQQEN